MQSMSEVGLATVPCPGRDGDGHFITKSPPRSSHGNSGTAAPAANPQPAATNVESVSLPVEDSEKSLRHWPDFAAGLFGGE